MRIRALWFGFVIVALIFGAVSLNIPATAQGDASTPTPQPSPTGNGGTATWAVKTMTFESNFPKGFSFAIEVTSTGGKLATATVYWRHSTAASRTRRIGTIDASGSKATADWQPTASDAVPQWVSVEYWWVLTDAAGNSYETDHKFDDYADNGHKWSHAASQDIEIFWEQGVPDDIGTAALQAMAQRRPFYKQNWAEPLGYRPRAIIYANFDTWAEWAPGAGTSGSSGGRSTVVAGQTSETWGATVQIYLPQYGVNDVAFNTIPHEVGHLYQSANGGVVGDTWFFEGDATYFEINSGPDNLAQAKQLAASGNLPSLQGGGPSGRGAFARDAYNIGYAFWVWVATTYGPDAHKNIWSLIDQGKPWKDALQTVTGKDFVSMETAFRTWLGAPNAEAPTPLPTLPLIFPPTPTSESGQ